MYGTAVYGYMRYIFLQGKGIPENERLYEENRQPRFADSFYRNGFTQNDKMRAE